MPAELYHPAQTDTPSTCRPVAKPALPARHGWRRAGRRAQAAAGWLLMLLLLLAAAPAAHAQAPTPPPECSEDEKYINNWYFGYKAGLDFNEATDSIPPKVLTDGQMVAPAGSGVMSDGTGALLFYSNGDTVWSRNHSIMPNGTGLGGNRLTTDGPLAIRKPGIVPAGSPRTYYLFTQDAQGGPKGLSYSEIVIPAGGQGEVVAATKNTLLTRGTAEKMTAVQHKNGCDVWLIVHGYGPATSGTENRGDAFLAYRITPAGVQLPPIISQVGARHLGPQGYRGQMKVTPDGEQLAVARYSETLGDSSSTVELFAFDAATGVVSNRRVVDSGAGRYYGVEFSPGRSRLYATVLSPPQLLQFDLTATNIPASKQSIPLKQTTPVNLGSMQAGPDGKIYVARENQTTIGFIAYPDSLGEAIAYADDSLTLGGRRGGLGLPNFNQSSLLRAGIGAEITACRQITFQASFGVQAPNLVYSWDFGDGTKSNQQNPVHTYATPGDYTVTLRITNECFCRETRGIIRVPNLPDPGSIAAPQTVCAGTAPAPLTSTAPATSDAGLPVVYQWQSSTDNVNFTLVGATGATYQPPANLPVGITYFRRSAQLLLPSGTGPYCDPRATASVAITVLPSLNAGTIAANQTICAGATPAPLTSTVPASGGAGTFTYRWESSADGGTTWTPVQGGTAETLTPGPLSVTTSFRRQVTSGPCPAPPTNIVTITVLPALTAGTIAADQTICAGATPAPLTSTTEASGGTGTIAYQWESSADGNSWTAIGGATGPTFAPAALNATTFFRRQASSGSCAPVASNVVTIRVAPALAAGSIAADQDICPGATPVPLTSTVAATGGTGSYTYQWQSSADGTAWTDIAGATAETFAPGPLTTTTYYRRQVRSGPCGPVETPAVIIRVLPPLAPGSIAADQTICAGTAPAPLTSTAPASGGSGTFTYQWQSSPNGSTWADIPGANAATLAPGALTATAYFRRISTNTCGSVASNSVVINVLPALTAGSIAASQTLCFGATPAPLTSTAAASGGAGTIAYQWESSADGTSWTALGGATAATFAPGPLSATTYFRRQATAGVCGPVPSNVIIITVLPALTAGSIGSPQTVCLGATPAPLTSTTPASGGTGSFAYQWQSSPDNSTWTDIAAATAETLTLGPLTATTYFRRLVTSGSCTAPASNSVIITVLPPLVAGGIAADQDVCAGTAPAPLTSTAPASGGTGTFAYQWESSADGTSWTAIGGATNETFAPGPLSATTFFRRRVTSGTGSCATAFSNVVRVRVEPLVTPAVSLAQPPVQCPGTPLTFTAVATNAGAAPTFRWFVNNAAVATGPTFVSSTVATNDVVRVEVTPTAGLCSTGPATASVTVTRTPTPPPTLAIAVQPGGPVCLGAPLTFSIASVTNPGPAPEYQWQVNGTDVPGATGPVFTSTTLREGQTVTLRLRTTNVCAQPVAAVSNGIPVRIQPPVDVDAGPDREILAGNSVRLEGRADGNYPVRWTPATGLTFPDNDPLRPLAAPTVTTTYTLSAGEGGCADSDQVTVTVRPPIRIPNAFTPNGDGRDDTWQIEFIEQFPENTVSVFNRWGNRVFSANNYGRSNEWRGDINGQPAPVGTYYYVVVTKGPLGRSYSGSITILY
ncbi:T9SS type B sorting domain-containing protein [Hymenobacter latericus]|uniref:T9SS type B sorting domain-containing protein n=1 Tax=Hymenobacter sp. YIM 151858-1 TaxID=2987688 RepID=UPI00222665FE|nr:gliding motility-associated C-terminal domain-containing protein [Hymenobacter sp. YIM 151858-1]UYZ59697.1 gliding motility-associated C-terminal domain-containing protein [Hymenobacter sp. YIM 151858-1]